MIHEIDPNEQFEHIQQENEFPLVQEQLSGSWTGRINRFKTWFKKIKNGKNDSDKPLILDVNINELKSEYKMSN